MAADMKPIEVSSGESQRQTAWDALRHKAKRLRHNADELEQIADALEQDVPAGSRVENMIWRLTFL